MSALLRDTVFNDFDTVISDQREVSFTLNESDKLEDEDFISEFTTDYNQAVSFKQQHQDLDYQYTDVQFVSLTSGILSLKVVNYYYHNGTRNMWSAPTVPPASIDRYGGADAICGSVTGGGAWRHVESQAKAVMPKLWWSSYPTVNTLSVNSDPFAGGVRYINGDFLFGRPNAIHHPYPAAQMDCVYATNPTTQDSEQDDYAQALADQLYDILGKRAYWDGVKGLTVKKSNWGSGGAEWYFHALMVNHLSHNQTQLALTKDDLSL